MKKEFKNMEELYSGMHYFYSFGMYISHIRIIYTEGKPYLYNENTKEKIKNLKNINRYLRLHELQFE